MPVSDKRRPQGRRHGWQRYDPRDGGGRAASGTAAESCVGRFGLLPSRDTRTSVYVGTAAEVNNGVGGITLRAWRRIRPAQDFSTCFRFACLSAGGVSFFAAPPGGGGGW